MAARRRALFRGRVARATTTKAGILGRQLFRIGFAYHQLSDEQGLLAQLVEHRTLNPWVVGSNPTEPTLVVAVQVTRRSAISEHPRATGPGVFTGLHA